MSCFEFHNQLPRIKHYSSMRSVSDYTLIDQRPTTLLQPSVEWIRNKIARSFYTKFYLQSSSPSALSSLSPSQSSSRTDHRKISCLSLSSVNYRRQRRAASSGRARRPEFMRAIRVSGRGTIITQPRQRGMQF